MTRRPGFTGVVATSAIALALMLVSSGCSTPEPAEDVFTGYGEVRYVYIAAEDAGRILDISVIEGDEVSKGDLVLRLDPTRTLISAEGAEAAAAAARGRTDAGGALDQALARAEADALAARQALRRTQKLFADGFVAQARLDADLARSRAADALVEQTRSERDAARSEARTALAAASLWNERVADADITAPAAGTVDRVYRRVGEVVAAGEPLAALSTPEGMRVRFFVPETELVRIAVGGAVSITRDGGSGPIDGRISYIANEPQFTPPVIYSDEERSKLVFLVEATPEPNSGIRAGAPVDVRLPR
ncbi:HlyD family efflux transporter periplasmic adaptor subunit [bacterium]|nr:HlyD family efflux transporter periplasmic adaptor subunit [bacterium]